MPLHLGHIAILQCVLAGWHYSYDVNAHMQCARPHLPSQTCRFLNIQGLPLLLLLLLLSVVLQLLGDWLIWVRM